MNATTTKHTPATPLPECEAVLRTKPHGIGRKMVYECPCGHATNPDHCPRSIAIVAEHKRRANAYPKLVEALRTLTTLCDNVPIFQLDGGKASVKAVRLAGKFTDAHRVAAALLRSLGEAA